MKAVNFTLLLFYVFITELVLINFNTLKLVQFYKTIKTYSLLYGRRFYFKSNRHSSHSTGKNEMFTFQHTTKLLTFMSSRNFGTAILDLLIIFRVSAKKSVTVQKNDLRTSDVENVEKSKN